MLTELAVVLPRELLKRISTGGATAADFQAARQLLKDNDFQSLPGANPQLDSLGKKLGDVDLPEPYQFPEAASG